MPGSEEGLEDLTNQERFNSEAGAVLVHGRPIYTLDESNPRAEAQLVQLEGTGCPYSSQAHFPD